MVPTICHPYTCEIIIVDIDLVWHDPTNLWWLLALSFFSSWCLRRKINYVFQIYSSESEVIDGFIAPSVIHPPAPFLKTVFYLPFSSAVHSSPTFSEISKKHPMYTFSDQLLYLDMFPPSTIPPSDYNVEKPLFYSLFLSPVSNPL